jgi:hypothetical protein
MGERELIGRVGTGERELIRRVGMEERALIRCVVGRVVPRLARRAFTCARRGFADLARFAFDARVAPEAVRFGAAVFALAHANHPCSIQPSRHPAGT